MKNQQFKWVLKNIFFRPGAVRRIWVGPLRGFHYRVSENTGLSPLYSGAERNVQQALGSLVKPDDVVIDVGANWGIHTLYLSKLVGQNGRVVALEPYPLAYDELVWHRSQNNCHNVQALPVALGDKNEAMDFVIGLHATTGHLNNQVSQAQRSGQKLIPVCCKTLDSLVEELGLQRLALIKIDAEGNEGNILIGAIKLIARFHPYFLIELHTPEQDVFVANWLVKHGYEIRRLSDPPILRTDVGWPERSGVWGTILATPPMENM